MKKTCIAILIIFLTGCGGAHWVKNTTPEVRYSDEYSIDIDTDWVQYKNTAIYRGLYFTKDGPSVNYINIESVSDRELQKKIGKLPNNILLEDWVSTYLSYRYQGLSFEKIADGPASIGIEKKPGFFTDIRLPGEKTLPTRVKSYVFREHKSLFIIEYAAPELFYFERDLHTFEHVAETFVQ